MACESVTFPVTSGYCLGVTRIRLKNHRLGDSFAPRSLWLPFSGGLPEFPPIPHQNASRQRARKRQKRLLVRVYGSLASCIKTRPTRKTRRRGGDCKNAPRMTNDVHTARNADRRHGEFSAWVRVGSIGVARPRVTEISQGYSCRTGTFHVIGDSRSSPSRDWSVGVGQHN